jgi:hypothetical protein
MIERDYWPDSGANALVKILGYLVRKQCDVYFSDPVLAQDYYEHGIVLILRLIAGQHGYSLA